jgi:hypothetical protein
MLRRVTHTPYEVQAFFLEDGRDRREWLRCSALPREEHLKVSLYDNRHLAMMDTSLISRTVHRAQPIILGMVTSEGESALFDFSAKLLSLMSCSHFLIARTIVPIELFFSLSCSPSVLRNCIALPIVERVILIVGLTVIIIVVVMLVRVSTGRRASNI